MIDLNSTKTLRHRASEEIVSRIDAVAPLEMRARAVAAIIERLEANPPATDDYWGKSISASAVGDECARRVQLGVWPSFHPHLKQPKRAPLDDKTRVIFARGHATEAIMSEWLTEAGFQISYRTSEETGEKQHGFVTAGGQIKGYADGVFTNAPHLWEHKTVGNKGWRKTYNHGLTKAYPNYDAQAHLLMPYMNADATLFTLLNADTGELYAELLPCDQIRAQAATDRAVHILKATRAGDLLPKAGVSAEGFPCGWCRFRAECWEE